jgi:hypothetical protein
VRYVVAAPDYLRGRLPPSRPEDLRQHQCVLLHARNNESEWHLVSGKKSIKLHVSGPVAARDFHAVSAFTYRGHGVGLLPSTYCDAQIASGELVRLLPDWSSSEIFRACRLPDSPISAREAAGIPRAPEGLEEPPLDSAAMTTAAAAIAIGRWCTRRRITRSPLHHHPAIGTTAHRMLRSRSSGRRRRRDATRPQRPRDCGPPSILRSPSSLRSRCTAVRHSVSTVPLDGAPAWRHRHPADRGRCAARRASKNSRPSQFLMTCRSSGSCRVSRSSSIMKLVSRISGGDLAIASRISLDS